MKYLLLLLLPTLCFADITFTQHIRPIFASKCAKCHNATTSLGNWLDYDEAFEKRQVIRNRVLSRSMPHFTNSSMTESQRDLIVDWVDTGAVK
jgi:uncharacterized membrane protein